MSEITNEEASKSFTRKILLWRIHVKSACEEDVDLPLSWAVTVIPSHYRIYICKSSPEGRYSQWLLFREHNRNQAALQCISQFLDNIVVRNLTYYLTHSGPAAFLSCCIKSIRDFKFQRLQLFTEMFSVSWWWDKQQVVTYTYDCWEASGQWLQPRSC